MFSVRAKSLSEMPSGTSAVIHEMQIPAEEDQRLRELGFCENAVISIVVKSASRLICEVQNTRIGLHHRLADSILVFPLQ